MSAFRFALLFLLIPFSLLAQILPREGSKLNYRLVGFSCPIVPKADKYQLEITTSDSITERSFAKHIVVSVSATQNRIIAEVPEFGRRYAWRMTASRGGKIIGGSPLHHFSTRSNDRVDTSLFRLRILQEAVQHKDDYVSIDGGGVLYDMKGRPVWFIPDSQEVGGYVLDMQFTPQGTITLIFVRSAYEINLNGDVLWKAPPYNTINGDTAADIYHHELKRLSNGHYMVLGMEFIMCKSVRTKDTSYIITMPDKKIRDGYWLARYSTIIEFDAKGGVVWSWKSSDHLIGSDFDYFNPVDTFQRFDPHSNAFYFDEAQKLIYLGNRNLNRIIKIEYPGGKILDNYGEIFKPGVPSKGSALFCNQHSIGRTLDGLLYYYNNNSCHNTDSMPTVVFVKEPSADHPYVEKVWEYTCTSDDKFSKKFGSGGNAIELPDTSLFVCMGNDYSKLFLVNRQKKVLWSALPEKYFESDAKWTPTRQYRSNIISRKYFENLIWNAEEYRPVH